METILSYWTPEKLWGMPRFLGSVLRTAALHVGASVPSPPVITGWHRLGVSKLVTSGHLCCELSPAVFRSWGKAPPLLSRENLGEALFWASVSSFVN